MHHDVHWHLFIHETVTGSRGKYRGRYQSPCNFFITRKINQCHSISTEAQNWLTVIIRTIKATFMGKPLRLETLKKVSLEVKSQTGNQVFTAFFLSYKKKKCLQNFWFWTLVFQYPGWFPVECGTCNSKKHLACSKDTARKVHNGHWTISSLSRQPWKIPVLSKRSKKLKL